MHFEVITSGESVDVLASNDAIGDDGGVDGLVGIEWHLNDDSVDSRVFIEVVNRLEEFKLGGRSGAKRRDSNLLRLMERHNLFVLW